MGKSREVILIDVSYNIRYQLVPPPGALIPGYLIMSSSLPLPGQAALARKSQLKFEEESSLSIDSGSLTAKELGCTNLKTGKHDPFVRAEVVGY